MIISTGASSGAEIQGKRSNNVDNEAAFASITLPLPTMYSFLIVILSTVAGVVELSVIAEDTVDNKTESFLSITAPVIGIGEKKDTQAADSFDFGTVLLTTSA